MEWDDIDDSEAGKGAGNHNATSSGDGDESSKSSREGASPAELLILIAQAEEKLAKAKEKAKTEVQPVETIKTFKRIWQHVFHPGAIKSKFALLLALAILSVIALTFGVSAVNDPPPVAEPGSAMTQEEKPVTGLKQWEPTQVGDNKVAVKVVESNSTPALDTQSFTITVNPPPPKIAKLTVLDGYNQRDRKTLSADGKTNIVQYSDNDRWETRFCSYVSYDFSDVSIPAVAAITSVVVYVEHFEEERFAQGKLGWAIGTGWPTKPVVWASINAPVHEEECHEAIDSWDVTSVVDTREKINSLQLQIKNNDNVAKRKTLIDYTYVVVEWD